MRQNFHHWRQKCRYLGKMRHFVSGGDIIVIQVQVQILVQLVKHLFLAISWMFLKATSSHLVFFGKILVDFFILLSSTRSSKMHQQAGALLLNTLLQLHQVLR